MTDQSITAPAGGRDEQAQRIVTGIVGPFGIAGLSDLGGKRSITFQLVVWREGDGPICTNPLRIEKPILSEHMIALWRWRLRKGQTIRLNVRDMEKPPEIMRTVEMLRLQGRPHDPALSEAAHEILNPPDYTHPKLGTLKAGETFHDVFEATGKWCGVPVRMSLEAGAHSIAEAADHLSDALDRQAEIDAQFRQRITDDYYGIWAEGWANDGEDLDRTEWNARFTPTDVEVDGSGALSIYYADGDLFAGHSIVASMSPEGDIEDSMMVG